MDSFILHFNENDLPKQFKNEIIQQSDIVIIRSNVNTMKEINIWVNEFGKNTQTSWNTRTTLPNGTRCVCSKIFVCQHSSFMKVKNKKDDRRSKDANCSAKITLKIKVNTVKTRATDPFVKKGLCCYITVSCAHTHSLQTAEALRFLPSDDAMKEIFIEYFDKGMGISESCRHHRKMLELQDSCNEEIFASGRLNPSERTVRYWYDKYRKTNFSPRCGVVIIEEEANKIDEESDKEMYHTTETDHLKDIESSDIADESDDNEDLEKIISSKKRKVESSSSSERESLNSSMKKFLSSSSEKKFQNNSFSVKKFQSSSSIEKKRQNSSLLHRKFHSNSSSDQKVKKPLLTKKSSDISSSSIKKLQNTLPSRKKIQNSSPSFRKVQSTSSVQKVPNFSKFERNRKNSSSSEREFKNASQNKESKSHSPEKNLQAQSSLNRNFNNSFSALNETKINSLEKELFNNSFAEKELDVIEKVSGQNTIDREAIFGRYVASELRALRSNPLLYLQTKQSILENLTSANFELINPE